MNQQADPQAKLYFIVG